MHSPLAERLRPRVLEDCYGQEHLLGPQGPISKVIQGKALMHSMVFWGPPGVGKTTVARCIVKALDAHCIEMSAVEAGLKELREVAERARYNNQALLFKRTVVFIDEIHRFNKTQQDFLLPFLESGDITLIGATTENPSYELNNALLSRVSVYVFNALDEEELANLIVRSFEVLKKQEGAVAHLIQPEAVALLARLSDGDARRALGLVDKVCALGLVEIDEAAVLGLASMTPLKGDRAGDHYYEMISALHKSVRGSCPDASLYWFARLIAAGVPPGTLARRMIRMASEDIGNADPKALDYALHAAEAYERLGSPEGELALAGAISYLAIAPKSNAVYLAYKAAMDDAKKGSYPVPLHLRNSNTKLTNSLGYGKGYHYSHDGPGYVSPEQSYLPKELGQPTYYKPKASGLEIKIQSKLAVLAQLKHNEAEEIASKDAT